MARVGRTVFLVAVLVLACADAAAAGRAPGGGPRPSSAMVACVEPTDPIELTSVEQTRELLVGTWIRCDGPALFEPLSASEVGLQVDADGSFFRVYEAADGSLIRAEGPDLQGRWDVIDTTDMNGPGSYHVDWTITGTVITRPTFFESTAMVRFVHMVGPSDSVRWNGPAPVPGDAPSAPPAPQPVPQAPSSELPTTGIGVDVLGAVAVAFAVVGLAVLLVTARHRPATPTVDRRR